MCGAGDLRQFSATSAYSCSPLWVPSIQSPRNAAIGMGARRLTLFCGVGSLDRSSLLFTGCMGEVLFLVAWGLDACLHCGFCGVIVGMSGQCSARVCGCQECCGVLGLCGCCASGISWGTRGVRLLSVRNFLGVLEACGCCASGVRGPGRDNRSTHPANGRLRPRCRQLPVLQADSR